MKIKSISIALVLSLILVGCSDDKKEQTNKKVQPTEQINPNLLKDNF
ncbi:TPA: hypothetical protein ACX6RO_001747 [Photobacterium damselae]